MADISTVSSDVDYGLLQLLGRELYDDYYGKERGGDSVVGGASTDVNFRKNAFPDVESDMIWIAYHLKHMSRY